MANALQADLKGESEKHCLRIQSLFVINDNSFENFIEFGWMMGWDTPCGGTPTWRTKGFVFISWQNRVELDSHVVCFPEKEINSGTTQRFTMSDVDSDTFWEFYWKGSHIQTENMDFHDGLALANGERKNVDDTSGAHFKNLRYIVGEETWELWNDLRRYVGPGLASDPGHYCRRIADSEMRVVETALAPPDECPLAPELPGQQGT